MADGRICYWFLLIFLSRPAPENPDRWWKTWHFEFQTSEMLIFPMKNLTFWNPDVRKVNISFEKLDILKSGRQICRYFIWKTWHFEKCTSEMLIFLLKKLNIFKSGRQICRYFIWKTWHFQNCTSEMLLFLIKKTWHFEIWMSEIPIFCIKN